VSLCLRGRPRKSEIKCVCVFLSLSVCLSDSVSIFLCVSPTLGRQLCLTHLARERVSKIRSENKSALSLCFFLSYSP
jgi:hypothetical protein